MASRELSFSKFRTQRKAVRLTEESLIQRSTLAEGQELPRVLEPKADNVNLILWARGHRELIAGEVHQYGGLLFRNFGISSVEEFERFIEAACGEALKYTERSSPRSHVAGNIYTSTDYPPEQSIFLHNEQSYNLFFPTKIIFYCAQAAEEGGETPIADSRKLYHSIRPEVRRRFEKEGYIYARNFGDGFGLSWQEAFQTSDPAAVEDYCRKSQIECEWKKGKQRLRTRQVRRVVAKHPRCGTTTWFNHLTFFHVSTLEPS
ncbi:MAG: TauD/TfdA family dioxygenase, partial [bacterium]|nr:TauD/TfdA family dioxygenase [bacterium]